MSDKKIMNAPENVEPLSLEQITERAAKIDPEKIAKSVLLWLIKNVENYIDNKELVYLIYFTYDVLTEDGLNDLKRLQELYYAIPQEGSIINDEKVDEKMSKRMLDVLDDVMLKAKEAMISDDAMLKELFDRIIYYHEMVAFSKLTGPIVKKYNGKIMINHFMYEPISMPVTVTKKMKKMVGDELVETDIEDEIVSQFVIPEGYSLEIELIKEMKN